MGNKKVIDFNKVKDVVDKQISEGQKAENLPPKLVAVQPNDPNLTMELNNDALEELIDIYSKDQTPENLNNLVRKIHDSRVLSPANLNEEGKPLPCLLTSQENGTFLAIYTSKQHIPEKPKSPAVVNIPYMAANMVALKEGNNANGIVINPFTQNLVFKKNLLERIDEIEKAIKAAPKATKVRLTQEQYVNFERHQFEAVHIPTRLFKEGQEFIDALCARKEELIDEFYEASYQQNRLYPYLPEDFSVMPMDISEELLVIRIDFPARNIVQGCSQRAYIAWKKEEKAAKYFLIEAVIKDAPMTLAEVTEDHKHISRGEAPVEGAELQRILDLVNGEEAQNLE